MKFIIFFFMAGFLSSPFTLSAQKPEDKQPIEWISLGHSDFTEGYKTLYRLNLEVPRGIHDIYDIKKGLQVIRFKLIWLPPLTNSSDVKRHFANILESQFDSDENLMFNQTLLKRLYDKLPGAKRHDEWFFEYSPEGGTKVFVADKKIHSLIGSQLNNALHQAWVHPSPLVTAKLMSRLIKASQ